jgi:NAD+ synthase
VEQTQGNQKVTPKQRINHIVKWLKSYARSAKISTFVVGISGGIDSSVVSALCARTGLKTIVVQMPIRQDRKLDNRSTQQATWLLEHHASTVTHINVDLTSVFNAFDKKLSPLCAQDNGDFTSTSELAFANSRARLRMMTLYQIAQAHGGLVVGTGNRVEDFGVGFFTKYGDGGVDISPIGDCLKTQVWDMGRELALPQEIIDALPTDGLWADGRTDEDQLGMTYPELEHAMELHNNDNCVWDPFPLTKVEKEQLRRYRELRAQNMHKMTPVPVCVFRNTQVG